MVHKVNNARIIQKLEKRYMLMNMDNSPLLLLDTIQPTTLVDELLKVSTQIITTGIDLSTTGLKVGFVVPANKRYTLRVGTCVVSTGTTARFSTLSIQLAGASEDMPIYSASSATALVFMMTTPITLNPGDTFYAYCGVANAGDVGKIRCLVDIEDFYG